jgi:hypothetical protein
VDVVDDPALLVENSLHVQCAGLGLLELIAEIFVGILDFGFQSAPGFASG